jgi:hypothetical protein
MSCEQVDGGATETVRPKQRQFPSTTGQRVAVDLLDQVRIDQLAAKRQGIDLVLSSLILIAQLRDAGFAPLDLRFLSCRRWRGRRSR